MSSSPRPLTPRDIVVVGCSAGGVEALPALLRQLPADLPASVFIVQHLSPDPDTFLATLLQRATTLRVSWAEQGERFERRHVYVAPPDAHLLFTNDHVRLSRSAKENHSRPSIDKLFRSAAGTHGSRVIGALLTGMLGDGVAGLRAIQIAGGATLVQDPADADYPELPSRALEAMQPDHVLPLAQVGAWIAKLAAEPAAATAIPQAVVLEAQLDHQDQTQPAELDQLGAQTPVSCPECHGPTWEVGAPYVRRYRCYLGHVWNAHDLLAQNAREVEAALWTAIRALGDQALTLETLASDAGPRAAARAEAYRKRARDARDRAALARRFVADLMRAAEPGR